MKNRLGKCAVFCEVLRFLKIRFLRMDEGNIFTCVAKDNVIMKKFLIPLLLDMKGFYNNYIG